MVASIIIDQSGKPAGVAGRAREDLVTGLAATATAAGGPFLAHSWSFISKAVDVAAGVRASTAIVSPTASVTSLTPIDVAGTYELQLAVDSGGGLGASAADIARITFYAGTSGSKIRGPLSTDPAELPRRPMAFGEKVEHNVSDAIDSGGNSEGWARERLRWDAVVQRMYEGKCWASGRVLLTGTNPSLVRGFNVANVTRNAQGVFDVTFTRAMPDASYLAMAMPRGTAGRCFTSLEATGGFRVTRHDSAGAAADADFVFWVGLGI